MVLFWKLSCIGNADLVLTLNMIRLGRSNRNFGHFDKIIGLYLIFEIAAVPTAFQTPLSV